jgi:hypothetical protein
MEPGFIPQGTDQLLLIAWLISFVFYQTARALTQ